MPIHYISALDILLIMNKLPLIPATQQTFARFKRHDRKQNGLRAKVNEHEQGKRRFHRALINRRQQKVGVKFERRSSQERRLLRNNGPSKASPTSVKGRNINTTA